MMKRLRLAMLILGLVLLVSCGGDPVSAGSGSPSFESVVAVDATADIQDASAPDDITETVTAETTVPVTETIAESTAEPVTEENRPTVKYMPPKVLMYHLILETPYNANTGLFVRPSDFEDQIRCLLEAGYTFLFADEFTWLTQKSVILTFDDGYRDNYTELFPILKKYGVKATVYVIGDLLDTHEGYLTAEQLREMSESGLVQFGCHTMTHQNLVLLHEDEVVSEYEECIERIRAHTGQDCKTVAYPSGSYNDEITEITKRYFKFAYTADGKRGQDNTYGYHIPRYYVKRGMSGTELLDMIENRE